MGLIDELGEQGHDVTLFASGDSCTPAKLVSCADGALREGVHKPSLAAGITIPGTSLCFPYIDMASSIRGFCVVMAKKGLIHRLVDPVDLPWVTAEERRRNLRNACPRAKRMRSDIGGAERRALAPSIEARIGHDPHEGASKLRYSRLRQGVDAPGIGEVAPIELDAGDLHSPTSGIIRTSSPR